MNLAFLQPAVLQIYRKVLRRLAQTLLAAGPADTSYHTNDPTASNGAEQAGQADQVSPSTCEDPALAALDITMTNMTDAYMPLVSSTAGP